jgi:hypothetical protein
MITSENPPLIQSAKTTMLRYGLGAVVALYGVTAQSRCVASAAGGFRWIHGILLSFVTLSLIVTTNV